MFVWYVSQISKRKQNGTKERDVGAFRVILRKRWKVNKVTWKLIRGKPWLYDVQMKKVKYW